MTDSTLFVAGEPDDERYTAVAFRHWNRFLTAGAEGVWPTNGLVVSQRAAGANGTVDVSLGDAVILGTEDGPDDVAGEGSYFQHFGDLTNVDVLGPHPANGSNPRNDIVGVQIEDKEYSGSVDSGGITVITGTPAGTPVDPTLPENFLALARVRVRTSASTIVTADITDLRVLVVTDLRLTAVRVQFGTTTTFPNNTATLIPFDAEFYDFGNRFSTGASHAYTVPSDGLYAVAARAVFGNNNAKQRGVLFCYVNAVNAARLCDNTWTGLATNDELGLNGSDVLDLEAGDIVTFRFEPVGSPTTNDVQMFSAGANIRRVA